MTEKLVMIIGGQKQVCYEFLRRNGLPIDSDIYIWKDNMLYKRIGSGAEKRKTVEQAELF